MTPSELGATVIPFGKHRLEKFDEIPLQYLEWLWVNNICYGELHEKLDCYMKMPRTASELAKLLPDKYDDPFTS